MHLSKGKIDGHKGHLARFCAQRPRYYPLAVKGWGLSIGTLDGILFHATDLLRFLLANLAFENNSYFSRWIFILYLY